MTKTFTLNGLSYRAHTSCGLVVVERDDGNGRWTRTYSLAPVMEARRVLGLK